MLILHAGAMGVNATAWSVNSSVSLWIAGVTTELLLAIILKILDEFEPENHRRPPKRLRANSRSFDFSRLLLDR